MEEKPKVTMKFEVSIPDTEGGPAKKYVVNRTLKARWSDDPQSVTNSILEEIKNYKGSFVGDMVISLASLMKNEQFINLPENKRSLDIDKWFAVVVENMIYSVVRDGQYKELLQDFEIPEWDGTVKTIDDISSNELEKVDIDRVMLLLTPKVRHILSLAVKDRKNKNIYR